MHHLPLKKTKSNLVHTLSFVALALAGMNAHAGEKAKTFDDVLAAQPEKTQARYEHRNPKETLEFFNIKPGMTVVEVLPGGGWYSKLLLPLLGNEGKLIGADYPLKLWNNFSWMTPERLEEKKTWVSSWSEKAKGWGDKHSASVDAFQFAALPESMNGSADAVLFIRALHNLTRFNSEGGYLDTALKETHRVLKADGVVGVVQHHAGEQYSDAWADGNNGYLKKSFVISKMAEHGFELVALSDVNANPKDLAKDGDKVWRLPPALRVKDESQKEKNAAIGESNRMTLLFKKVSR